jgi:tetratricopeptide (TPR) repeat protein
MAQGFRLKGDLDRAIASGERALAVAAAVGDFRLQVATDIHLGPAYAALGDYRRAIEISRRSIRSLTGDWIHERFRLAGFPAVGSRINLVQCLAELGEFEEGVPLADEAVRLAESIEDPYSQVFAYFGAGMLWLLKGELPRAIGVLEHGLALCEALALPLMFPPVGASLGAAYALSGRVGEAIPLLERAVAAATSMNLANRYSSFLARLGEAYLLAGRPADARALGERALRFARDHRERGHEAYALRLLAEVAAAGEPGPREGAESPARQALELAEALEMRPLQSQCRLALARLHARAGRRAEAEDELARALKTFRELDMPLWLERAEADLRTLA